MRFENLLAARTLKMHDNAIREILKVVSRPGMISLAGGIPAPESFPMGIMDELSARVIRKYGSGAFQYDLTEGFMPLREALSGHLAKKGIPASPEEIIIASGSQGFLDAVGKVLITPGDRVAVEAPTYLGALSAFTPYEPEYVRLDTDEDGVVPADLERVLACGGVKFVYLVPTFQNPTGRTIPLARRREIAGIIQRHDALLVEDDPYSDLRYRGEPLPPIKSFAPEHVMYVGTLSKVLAPGLRIGFAAAPRVIREWLVRVKQGTDLHTGTFSQALAAEYLSGGYLERHLPEILSIYRPRQEAMTAALADYFPRGMRWSRPEGGMFIWAEGPEDLDMEKVYKGAVGRNTAFVPGKYFYVDKGEGEATMRLNYTMAGEAEIRSAVRILGEEIAKAM
ncbi:MULTISPECIES: PLP-dependent aminotransferase family protein [Desulfococcus]|uniref:Putative transcriptional regulator, GntR family n=1 Tax=Desulfococcus multivorans DSM 2059 TaxID=1121405 RepID=S7TFD8_DESML|nr:PLP-dependent aminotransferase family protein [Desulfococcus multivorans]AOY58650.1 transcriptional regulator, GntR family with aminotransferase domain [Desulfococcus multivorans]AQV00940.1 GntR family transcriptional regulator [Desulfococcus multivorans]EPR35305.1 putative transcriptional regulator, GntR family [Desulfococcus multivorans DSM 2059]SJZ45572.1 2-aminoadipate transaminase [Desulfococcus multivorans DSM 2059]